MLDVKAEISNNTVILRCVGRMVRGHETALLCAALAQRERDIIVDLSKVETIDAAGIGALLSLQAAGIYLRLLNPAKAIREVLRVTALDTLFEILASPPAVAHEERVYSDALVPAGANEKRSSQRASTRPHFSPSLAAECCGSRS